uniref:Uncharacterized protein n=1 Tax=Panagrolaimus sp. ES5 TaxID=591445 RepID=A0AC34FTZ7_9BILA
MKSTSSYIISEQEIQEMSEKQKENHRKDFPKKDSLSNVNSSTLSLQIAAYENSVEASHANECKKEEDSKRNSERSSFVEKCKNAKQILTGSALKLQEVKYRKLPDSYDFENNCGNKSSQTYMKSTSSYVTSEQDIQKMSEKRKENRRKVFPKKDSLSNVNSSTLSLQIAAYENSVEASHANECNKEEASKRDSERSSFVEKCKNAKQILTGSALKLQEVKCRKCWIINFS